MTKDRFFFEEDPTAGEQSQLTWGEHTDTFLSVMDDPELAIKADKGISLEPSEAAVDMETNHIKTSLVDVEYGVVKQDYVVHITPLHPKKNLSAQNLLNEAVKTAVRILNEVVPTTLTVEIHMPRADYEVKAISFVIREGAVAWNLDLDKLASDTMPKIVEQVGKICMLA